MQQWRRGQNSDLSRITGTCNKSDPHSTLIVAGSWSFDLGGRTGMCYDLCSALALIAIYAFPSLMSSQPLFSKRTFVPRFSFLQLPISNSNLDRAINAGKTYLPETFFLAYSWFLYRLNKSVKIFSLKKKSKKENQKSSHKTGATLFSMWQISRWISILSRKYRLNGHLEMWFINYIFFLNAVMP